LKKSLKINPANQFPNGINQLAYGERFQTTNWS